MDRLGRSLTPNEPSGYEAMARALLRVGRPAESLDYVEQAERLDPRSSYSYLRGAAEFHQERYEAAVSAMRTYASRHPDSYSPYLYLAAAYGHLERQHEARDAVATYSRIFAARRTGVDLRGPSDLRYSRSEPVEAVASLYLKVGGAEERRLRDGLRKAGLDQPPEIVDSSPDGIALRRRPDVPIGQLYEMARTHCEQHGKTSHVVKSAPPSYEFSCL